MAVTKIWKIKDSLERPIEYIKNPDKTDNPNFATPQDQSLETVMSYAENEEKTEQKFFVTGINCSASHARSEFITVKKQFAKEGGTVAFHAYQSFMSGETTPDEAHAIGKELAARLWGDKYQVVVATHLNTSCLHNHFVLNSISFVDGKRFHDCNETYAYMRKVSDQICKEHGLSTIENPVKDKRSKYMHMMDEAGMPTRYSLVRMAIDDAIKMSHNMREFDINLKAMGYTTQFNSRRKYWTVIPKGWTKQIRLARLGEEYTNERIEARVLENADKPLIETFQRKTYMARQYKLPTRKSRIKKVGGLKGLYLRYCYELGYLPKYKQNPKKVHYLLRNDLLKLDKLTKEIRLLGDHEIGTTEELLIYKESAKKEITLLEDKRYVLRNEVRRKLPEETIAGCKKEIEGITEKLKKLREDVKLCEDIKEKSPKIEKILELMDKEREKEMMR